MFLLVLPLLILLLQFLFLLLLLLLLLICFKFVLCRYWQTGFSKEENRVKARTALIQKVKEAMPTPELEERTASTSTPNEESWEQAAKRRRIEKQEEVRSNLMCTAMGWIFQN